MIARPCPANDVGRNEISNAAHAVLDYLDANQIDWSDFQTWQDQIEDAAIEAAMACGAFDGNDGELGVIRQRAISAAARLIDAINEIDRCIAAGEA